MADSSMEATAARRRVSRWHLALVGALAYVPLLLTEPGRVSADTKSYLTLDPGRLIERARSMWDPHIGLGTVTHQTLGYLFPMGPYYWVMERLGVPDWLAQRLWLGTLVFAAGAGVLWLARVIGLPRAAALPMAVAYAFGPYVLHYAARISAILLPWAGLPWMIGCAALALRTPGWRGGGWKWPARFALVVALVGSVNATSLLLAGLGPVLWIVAEVVDRRVGWRAALGTAARIGLLTAAVSTWWIAGLWAQGRYGVPILRYTETYEAVAGASSSTELLRGLGYWFFYGGDRVSQWVEPSEPYLSSLPLIALGFAIAAVALTGLARGPLPRRRSFVLMLVVGLGVAVGAHPLSSPSAWGRFFEVFVETTSGQAMRSTPRAAPLYALALAAGIGAVVAWAAARVPRRATIVSAGAVVVLAAQLPALFTGDVLTSSLLRDESVPEHWQQATAAMDAGDDATRVYETPGSDFAYYRWGGTVDPITPGLIERPYVARELVPYGGAGTADLLNALEDQLQVGVLDPAALADLARLLGVGTIATRNDLQFERFLLPQPRAFWEAIRSAGLAEPQAFGAPAPNEPDPRFPLLNEQAYNVAAAAPDPPPVALLDVPEPRAIARAVGTQRPVVLAGSGEGIVDAVQAGLLHPDRLVAYAATVLEDVDRSRLDALLADGAELLVTDSNRRAGRRWGSVSSNIGYTEQAGEEPLREDPQDNRLDLFPGAEDDSSTVAELTGVRSVQATSYGNPVSYTPEDRPANALDGDPLTAWRAGAFVDVRGERLRIELAEPVTTDRITLLQPQTGSVVRFVTQARLRFDGDDTLSVSLDDTSRTAPGQVVELGEARTFQVLEIEVEQSNYGVLPSYSALPGVGFAEVVIPGRGGEPVRVDEVLRLPTDLLDAVGEASAGHPLTILMSRDRIDPATPNRFDPQLSLARRFSLPTERTFTLTGTARLSGIASDELLDDALGIDATTGTTAVASGRVPGDPRLRGASALDGDPATAWTTPLRDVVGQTLTIEAGRNGEPIAVSGFALAVVADGEHSVPTALSVSADGRPPVSVAVPPITDSPTRGAVAEVEVALPRELTGRTFSIRIDAVREVTSPDYFSGQPNVLPVAVAELQLPGVGAAPPPAILPDRCRDDLVTVDGAPVPARLVGETVDAAARRPIALEACAPLSLDAGEHVVRTAAGRDLGIDVDQVVLRSGAELAAPPVPEVTVLDSGATSMRLEVAPSNDDSWLLLGQSHSDGWRATVDGGDLGAPLLVNGFANAWRLPAHADPLEVSLRWTPQRVVDAALVASAIGAVVVLVLARPRRGASTQPPPAASAAPVTNFGRTRSNIDPDLPNVPRRAPSRRWEVITVVLVAIVAGIAPALLAAAAAEVARRAPAWRDRLLVVPVALLGVVTAIIAYKQVRYDLPATLDWPQAFPWTHGLTWAAVAIAAGIASVGAADLPADAGRPPRSDSASARRPAPFSARIGAPGAPNRAQK